MAELTCRCCGAVYEHPTPGSLATRRWCAGCSQLPEAVRTVLERHQAELTRLRAEVAALKGGGAAAEEE